MSSAAGFPTVNGFLVQIDNEMMLVTAGAGTTTWTVSRAQNNTVRVAHSSGATVSLVPVLSVPNFYGAHGYDPNIPNMSASFFAAGPDFAHGTLNQIHNIDIAPTIERLLGVAPASTMQRTPIVAATRIISRATDVTSQLRVDRTAPTLDHASQTYIGSLSITNTSNAAIAGTLRIALPNLTAFASLDSASITVNGVKYNLDITYTGTTPVITIPKSVIASLPAGQTLARVTLKFKNPSQ